MAKRAGDNGVAERGIKKAVEYVPTSSLVPYARNARKHPDSQVAQIAASIQEFGFLVPVLLDGGNGIIAGHGRVLAAQKLGLAEVPCLRSGHLTETQKRAYILADNKLTENAGWDDGLLRLEIGELKADGFDLGLTGFDEAELSRLLTPLGGGDDPPAPEVRAGTCIKPGDCVYDPFLGSGTTLIACERLGRVCLGMEIDPRWCDVAIRRWQGETGQVATRAADGAPYEESSKVAT